MNNSLLDNFKTDINNIIEYIKHIELVNEVERKNIDSEEESLKRFIEHFHSFHREKKLFEYKAIIISLYGVLEKYIGLWIKEHINTLSSLILDYRNMPEKLSKSHFDLSIKLISMISENKFAKYEHLTKEEILESLSLCIREPLNYELNSDAFSPMSGNLKHSKIVEAFKPLDIDLELMLKQNIEFSHYLKSKFGKNIANRGSELFNKIDDLVVRRNDIAHGTNIDDIILGFDEYIEFLGFYGKAIFETLIQKEIEYESIHSYIKIEKVINIFKDRTNGVKSILAFELNHNKIFIGDTIIMKTEDNNFYKKRVLTIGVDNVSINGLQVWNTKNIAINLDITFNLQKNNQTFYIKRNS